MRFKFLGVLAILSFDLLAYEQVTAIPELYIEVWAIDLKQCNVDRVIGTYPPGAIQIESNSIKYFESGGRFVSGATRGKNEIAILLDYYVEENSFFLAKHYLLSGNGNELTEILEHGNSKMVYKRCSN